MRTAISCPEPQPDPWDPETLAAWKTWKAFYELAFPLAPDSHVEGLFWGFWDQSSREHARRALFRHMSLSFNDLKKPDSQYPQWQIVNDWLLETKEILEAEAARERTIGGPESWDSVAKAAWDAWIRAWELTSSGRGISEHKVVFWRYWRANSLLDSTKLLHRHMELIIRVHEATTQVKVQCRIVNSWLRQAEMWIKAEEKRSQ